MQSKFNVYILAAALCAGCLWLPASGKPAAGVRTGALPDSLWNQSVWIAAADAPVVTGRINGANLRAADGASWFVSDIRNDKKLKSAQWMTSGLGVYTLYVNGHPIGNEILKPGFTHAEKTKRSFTYDITDAMSLRAGAVNRLSVQSTPGWWADKIITTWNHDGMTGRKPAFRGVVELTYTDGTRQYLGTGTDGWLAGVAGPVTHAAIFDGEEFDARRPMGYLCTEIFTTPEVSHEFKGEILPSEGAEVYFRDDLTLSPQQIYVWSQATGARDGEHGRITVDREYKPGEVMTLQPGENLVIDFGQNSSAVPEFVFSAPEGTTLTCLPSEILNDGNGAESRGMDGPEGSIHRRNLRSTDNMWMKLIYTFADNGNRYVTYRPERTFFGYRYVSLSADGPVRIKAVKSVPVSSIAKGLERGVITTGNNDINKLISNTIWGMRSNYLSIPTDCPQRDERLGWTADTQVFSETGTYFADTRGFFHKWMRDMRDSQSPRGGFPGVAPTAQYGAEMSRLGWADAGVIVPWVIWKQYADSSIVAENWEAMDHFVSYIGSVGYDHNALRSDNGDYQWADWLSYEPLESCSGRKDFRDFNGDWHVHPEAYEYWNYLSANYLLMDAEMMCDMGRAIGHDVERYEDLARTTRNRIIERYIRPDGSFTTRILNTMQTPALFALRNRLVDGEARTNMIERLRSNFAEHGNCLQTGFLGTSILMPTLTENGMADIAYELLFQRRNPSWLYSIDNGATTIWERWNSYMTEYGMGPAGMNSFNHYAYGCVCEWVWESVAGIAADPSDPGFRRIIMKPVPDRRLGFVDATYDSAAGQIHSSWRYDGGRWLWDFTIPEGATAIVTLPGESDAIEYAAGTHHIIKNL